MQELQSIFTKTMQAWIFYSKINENDSINYRKEIKEEIWSQGKNACNGWDLNSYVNAQTETWEERKFWVDLSIYLTINYTLRMDSNINPALSTFAANDESI